MNRSQAIRRALALAAAAAAATAVALTVAAPASAHRSDIEGSYDCDARTGNWVVKWSVTNDMKHVDAALTRVDLTPAGTTVTGLEVGTALAGGATVVGVQVVPSEETSASLAIQTRWVNGRENDDDATVEFEGTCEKPEQPVTPTPTATPEVPPTATPTASPPGAATPTATPAPGAGGGLPVTGSAVGGIMATAAALLALGVGLFLASRRRRIRFTA